MHSRYSIRDEAAQQSEAPPPMCDAVLVALSANDFQFEWAGVRASRLPALLCIPDK
jgi:hypothetical protein